MKRTRILLLCSTAYISTLLGMDHTDALTADNAHAALASLTSKAQSLLNEQPQLPERSFGKFDELTMGAGIASTILIAQSIKKGETRVFLTDASYAPWLIAGGTAFWHFIKECYYRFRLWRERLNNTETKNAVKKNIIPRIKALEKTIEQINQEVTKQLAIVHAEVCDVHTKLTAAHTEIAQLTRELDELRRREKKDKR